MDGWFQTKQTFSPEQCKIGDATFFFFCTYSSNQLTPSFFTPLCEKRRWTVHSDNTKKQTRVFPSPRESLESCCGRVTPQAAAPPTQLAHTQNYLILFCAVLLHQKKRIEVNAERTDSHLKQAHIFPTPVSIKGIVTCRYTTWSTPIFHVDIALPAAFCYLQSCHIINKIMNTY